MIRRLPSLRRDTRGTSVIEFALLAPVMIALICGTIDLGYIFLAQSTLSGAVAAAARTSAKTQERSKADRDATMRQQIAQAMAPYLLTNGGALTISTRVYSDFASSRPEDYTDTNGNGRYDPPSGTTPGEPFVDTNGNGVWDEYGSPIATDETGAVGDVVSYTATYPVRHLMEFMIPTTWGSEGVVLTATAVMRNEPVKTE